MNKKYRPTTASGGFTIVELMVASAVFALVLLVALTGFLQIGHLFYKGVTSAQTQDTTRQVVNDISNNLKATPDTVDVVPVYADVSQPYSYFCVGAYRYTFANYMNTSLPQNGKPVEYISSQPANYDPTDPDVNMGLVKERVGAGSCPVPCVTAPKNPAIKCTTQPPINNNKSATELLGNGMRVGDLSLEQPDPTDPYSLSVTLVYGDFNVLDYSSTSNVPVCKGSLSDQRFCAVNQVSTSVYEGELHP